MISVRHLLAALAGLAVAASTGSALPQLPPQAADAEDSEYGSCPEGLACLPENDTFAARAHEVTMVVVSHLGFNKDADEELTFRVGAGIEFAPWVPRDLQWLRLTVFQTTTLGSWGDDDHGWLTFEDGLKVRFSGLAARQIFDVYPVLGGGVVYSPTGNQWGVRPSIGLGLRALRAFSAELAFDVLWDPDGGFDELHGADPVLIGASTLVGFDTCALGDWCDHDPYQQSREDRTCCTYETAATACQVAGAALPALCGAVHDAMDLSVLCRALEQAPPAGTGQRFEACFDDPVGSMLAFIDLRLRAVPDVGPVLQRLHVAAQQHRRMLQWRDQGRAEERAASQRGRSLSKRRVYAPFVTDLRGALGCRIDGLPRTSCTPDACADPRPSCTPP